MGIKEDIGNSLRPDATRIWKLGAPSIEGVYELPIKTYFGYTPESKGRIGAMGIPEGPDYPEEFEPELIEVCGIEVKDPKLHAAILERMHEPDLIEEVGKKYRKG